MDIDIRIPPVSPLALTPPDVLAERLRGLIGTSFPLTKKTRTDGAALRRLVAESLAIDGWPPEAGVGTYELVPPSRKGVPRITRELIDTYLVTSGKSYNLQIWNRIPASNGLLIRYDSGESFGCNEVRLVLVRVEVKTETITTIVVCLPGYLEARFGKFGKPTIKHQLMISAKARAAIYARADKVYAFPDTHRMSYLLRSDDDSPPESMAEGPRPGGLYSINALKRKVADRLIGQKLDAGATKHRGQALEKLVLVLLGYEVKAGDLLSGGFPDIRNQLLEVKVQDSPTVDLGKYSPQTEAVIMEAYGLTTLDVRYLIALTNPDTLLIEAVILAPGERLGALFSYVADRSFKCQRSIPMAFFDQSHGQAVFNP
jgi:hypothetical protein